MRRPLSFLTAKRSPPQSGKKTASPSTVGVAETSPPVVNTHCSLSLSTLAGLMECSAGWLRVLPRFCPSILHWPDRDSLDWPCALSAQANEITLNNAAFGNNTLRFFMGIRILLLELGFAITLARVFPWQALEQRSECSGVRPLSIPGNRHYACQSAEGFTTLWNLLICIGMTSRKTAPQIKVPAWQCQQDGRSPVSWLMNRNADKNSLYWRGLRSKEN